MENKKILVGISQGDINGIGYEIIFKTLSDPFIYDMCKPVIYGSPKVGAYHRKALNISNINFNNIRSAEEAVHHKINIINCLNDNVRVELGKATAEAGRAAFISLEKAVDDLTAGRIDVLVTAPIDKSTIQSEKFKFNGHTEYLMHKTGSADALMFLISDNLRIGVVTGHLPLKDVASAITKESVLKKLRIMNKSLKFDFLVGKPRIAVLGLNPHAGEDSLLGTEECNEIIPAIKQAEKENIMVFGPFPSDGFFGSDSFTKFDGILAMYHDQGLIPFKTLSFDSGVNFTAGLPFVRTSPDHGTAYSITGKGIASENSFRQAVYLACDIFRNRKLNREITKNPLKQQKIDNHSDKADELPPEINYPE